jgi:hypothetical protein
MTELCENLSLELYCAAIIIKTHTPIEREGEERVRGGREKRERKR